MLSYRIFKNKDRSREEIREFNDGSSKSAPYTELNCRTVRIGSYKYVPKEKVYITTKGIRIVAPSLKDENKEVALQIQMREVVKLLVHFGKGLPVIFIYTMSSCGIYIRRSLDMTDDTGPYYNPVAREDPFKRITLLPEIITDESKIILKSIFEPAKVLDELSTKEANEILIRTCPKEVLNASKVITRSASLQNLQPKCMNPTDIRQILIYPPGKGGIPINTEDYMCLAQDQFLNDVIIDFYLKYLLHEILTPTQKEKTHIFSTFFYKRLTTKPSKMNRATNPHEWDSALTPAQKRHVRVKGWTKNVNIFEKDFIVVPINENCHWFLAIICFPNLDGCRSLIDNRIVQPQEIKRRVSERKNLLQIGNTTITPLTKQEQLTLNCDGDNLSERDEAEAEESDLDMMAESDEEEEKKPPPTPEKRNDRIMSNTEPVKQPCILIFDSLAGASRSRVVATLRDYLTCEYQAKITADRVFNKDNMKGACPKIPQQNNFTDCGLYLLQYVEHFFRDPIMDYALPIKQLSSWFDEIVVTRKREEISELLKRLMADHNPDVQQCLPDITFPTQNGKLIESDTENQEGEQPCDTGSAAPSEEHEGSAGLVAADSEFLPAQLTPVKTVTMLGKLHTSGDSVHIRKTLRLAGDTDARAVPPVKQSKLHSDLVKDIQNSLIASNKPNQKANSDKRLGNNSVANVGTVKSFDNSSENSNVMSYLKSRRINKMSDDCPSNDSPSIKKFKRNEC